MNLRLKVGERLVIGFIRDPANKVVSNPANFLIHAVHEYEGDLILHTSKMSHEVHVARGVFEDPERASVFAIIQTAPEWYELQLLKEVGGEPLAIVQQDSDGELRIKYVINCVRQQWPQGRDGIGLDDRLKRAQDMIRLAHEWRTGTKPVWWMMLRRQARQQQAGGTTGGSLALP